MDKRLRTAGFIMVLAFVLSGLTGCMKVVEDGQAVEIGKNDMRLAEHLSLQKGIIVSGSYMDGDPTLFTQRAALAKTGIVFVTLLRKAGHRKKLVHPPRIAAYGLLLGPGENLQDVIEDAEHHLEGRYAKLFNEPDLAEAVRIEMRRFFKHHSAMKPAVISMFLDI